MCDYTQAYSPPRLRLLSNLGSENTLVATSAARATSVCCRDYAISDKICRPNVADSEYMCIWDNRWEGAFLQFTRRRDTTETKALPLRLWYP